MLPVTAYGQMRPILDGYRENHSLGHYPGTNRVFAYQQFRSLGHLSAPDWAQKSGAFAGYIAPPGDTAGGVNILLD